MSVLVLDEHDVERLLTMDDCIEAMEEVLAGARPRRAVPAAALRRAAAGRRQLMGLMPAYRAGARAGVRR